MERAQPFKKHHGQIGLRSGQLEFAHGELTSGRVVIDLSNIVCFDLQGTEWHDVLIKHLQSDDFFDVARFPEALVVINGARRIEDATLGQPNLEIAADLTLKGASAPLKFLAAAGVTPDGKAAAQAVFSFDRTRWNVLYGSVRFFIGLEGIWSTISLNWRSKSSHSETLGEHHR